MLVRQHDAVSDREPVDDTLQFVSGAHVVPVISGEIDDHDVRSFEQDVYGDLPERVVTKQRTDRVAAEIVPHFHRVDGDVVELPTALGERFAR
jgi:hypothetical protein